MYLPPRELALLRLLLARAGEIVSSAGAETRPVGRERCFQRYALQVLRIAPRQAASRPIAFRAFTSAGTASPQLSQPDGRQPGGELPRLAILPFAAGFGVPDYLGMAVTEEAMERLKSTRYAIASLVAQDSVFTLARRGLAAQEIGTTLRADLVLTGQLLATPGHDRLRAEMIRAEDGAQLWVEDLLVERGRIGALTSGLVNRLTCRLHSGGLSIAAAAEPAAEVESFSQSPRSE